MNWLNFHHLMYFRTIAIEGSISRASEKLRVGQPALSAQLKLLEEQFGHQLFERRNRRLILTDAGKAALKYAMQIHGLGNEMIEVLSSKSFAARPHINLGVMDSVPKNLVVKIIERARKIDDASITVLDGSGDELYRQLIAHSIDLVISNHHLGNPSDKAIYTRSIGKYPISVFAAKKFQALKSGFPGSLNNQNFILPTRHSKLRHDIEHYFESKNIHYQTVAETQDTAVQKLLAMDGLGLIIEPDFSVKTFIKEKKLVKIGTLKGVDEEFFISSTKRVIENPAVVELMDSFSQLAIN